jgi:hypothetical protein
MVRRRVGRKITKITHSVLTDTPSVQGVWTPSQSAEMPAFGVKMHESWVVVGCECEIE